MGRSAKPFRAGAYESLRGDLPTVNELQAGRLRAVPHYKNSLQAELHPAEMLGFYVHWLAAPFLAKPPPAASIADMGAGYGWLAIALALGSEECRILAVDANEARLNAARKIADILGVAHRIQWCVARLGCLPFRDGAFDAVFAIEVVEHIDRSAPMMADLGRVCGGTLTITTPNRLFPIIHHDTALPFAHWLPPRARRAYARVFDRGNLDDGNRFWSPRGLEKALPEFVRTSAFMHFAGWGDYLRANERLPLSFRKSGMVHRWYRIARLLGRRSSYVLPTCSMTLRQKAGVR